MPSLNHLVVPKNRLTDVDFIKDFLCLSKLDLSNNPIKDMAPVCSLVELRSLDVSFTNVTRIPKRIKHLVNLKVFMAKGCKLKSIESLAECSELNTVVISDCPVRTLAPLTGLELLRSISANNCGLLGLPNLSKLFRLKQLRVMDNSIDFLPESLSACTRLEILDARRNLLQIESLAPLEDMPRVTRVHLAGCPAAARADYKPTMMRICPGLAELDGRKVAEETTRRQVLAIPKVATKARTKAAPKGKAKADPAEKPKALKRKRDAVPQAKRVTTEVSAWE